MRRCVCWWQRSSDALEIEARAKRRLADEYDAAEDRGDIAGHGGARNFKVAKPDLEKPTLKQIGLTRQQVHEALALRDASFQILNLASSVS
jgi:hypothetical protein